MSLGAQKTKDEPSQTTRLGNNFDTHVITEKVTKL